MVLWSNESCWNLKVQILLRPGSIDFSLFLLPDPIDLSRVTSISRRRLKESGDGKQRKGERRDGMWKLNLKHQLEVAPSNGMYWEEDFLIYKTVLCNIALCTV